MSYHERTPPDVGRVPRYTATAQALHWITAAFVAAVLPLAWAMTSMARDNPSREGLYTLHKSIGVTILVIVAVRLIWRAVHPAPPEDLVPPGLALIGRISHWLLYAIFVVMPVSGYILSSAGGHPVEYFWLFELPSLPNDKALAGVADTVHVLGQWAVYVLVGLHILATAWHVAIRRDGTLDRMLPAQRFD